MLTRPLVSRRSGFVLGLVLAFMAGLFFTVLAMHFQSANARAAQLQLESHVQREWAANSDGALLAAQAASLTSAETDLKLSETLTSDSPVRSAARIFKDPLNLSEATPDRLPSWSYGAVLAAHALNAEQSFLQGKKIKLTFQQFLPYAAYAPHGRVTLNKVGYYSGIANEQGAGWPIWLAGGTSLQVSQALAYCWSFSASAMVPAGTMKFPLLASAERVGELLRQQAMQAQARVAEPATTLHFFNRAHPFNLDTVTDQLIAEHVHPRTWASAKVIRHMVAATNQISDAHYSVYTMHKGDFPESQVAPFITARNRGIDFVQQRVLVESIPAEPLGLCEYRKTVASILKTLVAGPSTFAPATSPTVQRMDLLNSSTNLCDWVEVLVAPGGRGMIGGAENQPGQWRGTLSVPSGRALSLPGLTIENGDLWLQRGSFLKICGDLTLHRIQSATAAGLNGRIVMEEGSTLYVQGNLRAEGSPSTGSLLLPTPQSFADGHYANRRRPITRTILCDGEVVLPFGTCAGLSLSDLARSRQETAEAAEWLEKDLPTRASMVGTGPYGPSLHDIAPKTSTFLVPGNTQNVSYCPLHPLGNKMKWLLERYSLVLEFASNAQFGALLTCSSYSWPFGLDRVPIVGRISNPGQADDLASMVQLLASAVGPARLHDNDITSETTSWTRASSNFKANDWPKIRDTPIAQNEPTYTSQGYEGGAAVTQVRQQNGAQAGLLHIPPTFSSYFFATDSQQAPLTPLPAEPGIFVRADRITVSPGASKAVGLFVATHRLQMDCATCIGSLFSLDGDIQASGMLLYHPYYTRASVYLPKRQDEYAPADMNTPIGPVQRGRILDSREPASEAANMAADIGLSEGHLTSFEVVP